MEFRLQSGWLQRCELSAFFHGGEWVEYQKTDKKHSTRQTFVRKHSSMVVFDSKTALNGNCGGLRSGRASALSVHWTKFWKKAQLCCRWAKHRLCFNTWNYWRLFLPLQWHLAKPCDLWRCSEKNQISKVSTAVRLSHLPSNNGVFWALFLKRIFYWIFGPLNWSAADL